MLRRIEGPWLSGLLITGAILLLLWGDLLPGTIQFSNDGPLGRLSSQCHELPQRFAGCWQDLNMVGYREGSAVPDISFALQWLLGPILFSKFYAPLALLMLGFSAWCFFRQLHLSPVAANLGALATVLNSTFFSAACWGAGPHVITAALTFLAMAALADTSSPRRWLRVILAGLAMGLAVSEGADVGALFSLLAAAFIIWQAVVADGPRLTRIIIGAARLLLVAVCAAWLAADAISELVANDIRGVTATLAPENKTEHWNWATQWSLPKAETLSLVVPGLFGYRDDTRGGGEYWGAIGRDPKWDDFLKGGQEGPRPTGFTRYSGGGIYAGVAVVLLAAWAGFQSLRRREPVFTRAELKWLWFWMAVLFGSLLLAYGRFAPFYRLLYSLPYVATIRNPAKFTHLLTFALMVLFAWGVEGLWRRYVHSPAPAAAKAKSAVSRSPLPSAGWFERQWLWGCLAVFGISIVAAIFYTDNRSSLESYLLSVQFDEPAARQISEFSIRQPWWFLLFFGSTVGFMFLLLRGVYSRTRQRWAAVSLVLIMVADLVRANQPWVVLWNFDQKYAGNQVVDLLREKPFEHRVGLLPSNPLDPHTLLRQIYAVEWAQQLFSFNNIQAADVVQLPRLPRDMALFDQTFHPVPERDDNIRLATRCWQLTNTRYLLGIADPTDSLNQVFDPKLRRYHSLQRFSFAPKPGIFRPARLDEFNAFFDPDGPYALFEFSGALPRAALYSQWQVSTNDAATLQELSSESFDPAQTVLVASEVPAPSVTNVTAQALGEVEFVSYSPKHVVLRCQPSMPSLLLLNDRYDPAWHVMVDGVPAKLLRCNFFMRGVQLGAGPHTLQFTFTRPLGPLWVSLSAVAVGILLLAILLVSRWQAARRSITAAAPVPRLKPRAPKLRVADSAVAHPPATPSH